MVWIPKAWGLHQKPDLSCLVGRGAGARDPPVGEVASCSIPLVLNHIQGKMTLSNSSWRDGLLTFMKINTSTWKTGTPSSVHSCPTICRLRVASFFAVYPPPQKLQPPPPFSAKNKLHPGPALQGLGTWVREECHRSTCFLLGRRVFCRAQATVYYLGPGLLLSFTAWGPQSTVDP